VTRDNEEAKKNRPSAASPLRAIISGLILPYASDIHKRVKENGGEGWKIGRLPTHKGPLALGGLRLEEWDDRSRQVDSKVGRFYTLKEFPCEETTSGE
jgi:hypothetical protein